MIDPDVFKQQWIEVKDRLTAKELLARVDGGLSVRCSGRTAMWQGGAVDAAPFLVTWQSAAASEAGAVHAMVYEQRPDVGAIAWTGGPFSQRLARFGGALPQVFDEQARHIGPMPPAIWLSRELPAALQAGGNALLLHGMPLCFGTTPGRLALNMELFEKCAKAYVLAAAAGGRVRTLPWLVRRIANGRLAKDARRAAEAFLRGELPEESKGY